VINVMVSSDFVAATRRTSTRTCPIYEHRPTSSTSPPTWMHWRCSFEGETSGSKVPGQKSTILMYYHKTTASAGMFQYPCAVPVTVLLFVL